MASSDVVVRLLLLLVLLVMVYAASNTPPGKIPPAATYDATSAIVELDIPPFLAALPLELLGPFCKLLLPLLLPEAPSSTMAMAPGPVQAKNVSTTALLYSTGRDLTSTSRMEFVTAIALLLLFDLMIALSVEDVPSAI